MPENLNPTGPQTYDDELARFADRLAGGEGPEVPQMAGEDRELAELMDTVVRLERALKADRPDPAMSGRIRANLLKAWEKSGPAADRGSFWSHLWPGRQGRSPAQQRLIGLIAAVVVIVLLLVAYPLISAGGATGPGAGGGGGAGLPVQPAFVVGGLIVLAGVVWWLSRPRR